jgi:hypothetical protein
VLRQLQRLVGLRASTIDLATVTHLEDLHDAGLIVDCVDHSVGTLPDAISLLLSGQLLATTGARIRSEALDSGNDAGADAARLDGFELLRGGRLDADAIACHAA